MRHTSSETNCHYQLGMAEQVRQAVEKTNQRLYGKRPPLQFLDSAGEEEEEEKTAVCKYSRNKEKLAPRTRFELRPFG
jgi:hypothetical protein